MAESLVARLIDGIRPSDQSRPIWRDQARPEQLPPDGQWTTWLFLGGRGTGKTRSAAEWITEEVASGRRGRLALIGPTAADVRDTMVEGESGILAVSSDRMRPVYEPSRRRLTWPNGAMALTFSAEEPERLRGPQHDGGWADELAAWRYGQECWDMFTFGLRLGANPQVVVTTTPRPTALLRSIMSDPHTTITRGTTYDNLSNLAPTFARQIIARYEGTRLGRQELNAEILDDVPGSLWNRAMLDADRVRSDAVPPMRRVVVAVDPAVTAREDSDETGIVVAGLGEDGHGYVLDDLTVRASPNGWAQRVLLGYDKWSADRIIGERNNGGEMVEYVIRSLRPNAPFAAVHASKGKYTRAEPVSALYEQHRVHHVGALPTLEDQMCSFTSNGTADGHDDRVDALVWALTELLVGGAALPFGWMTQDEEA